MFTKIINGFNETICVILEYIRDGKVLSINIITHAQGDVAL